MELNEMKLFYWTKILFYYYCSKPSKYFLLASSCVTVAVHLSSKACSLNFWIFFFCLYIFFLNFQTRKRFTLSVCFCFLFLVKKWWIMLNRFHWRLSGIKQVPHCKKKKRKSNQIPHADSLWSLSGAPEADDGKKTDRERERAVSE